MNRNLTLTLLLRLPPLPPWGGEIANATGHIVKVPDHPQRILAAGPPAAVLLGTLTARLRFQRNRNPGRDFLRGGLWPVTDDGAGERLAQGSPATGPIVIQLDLLRRRQ
jgi:hypothetical protein